MELLVLGVAQHQAVFGVPQHEGLGNVFDRVLQAQLRLLVELVGVLLRRDVDDDADEMRRFRDCRREQARRAPAATPNGRPRGACGTPGRTPCARRAAAPRPRIRCWRFPDAAVPTLRRNSGARPWAGSPRISYIDFDQKIVPSARSQSHMPQWPRSSALSSRSVAMCERGVGFRRLRRLPVEGAPPAWREPGRWQQTELTAG